MVIILDKHKRPMGFTTPRRARILLNKKRAVVHKVYPFTIRMKDVDSTTFEKQKEYQLKIDPGSKHTGITIVNRDDDSVALFAQIEHRGDMVKGALYTRSGARRNRRNRKTRYRRCKFVNHYLKKGNKYKAKTSRPEGWLPPSIKSIPNNTINWVRKLCKLINITMISVEYAKFDTQLMDNPDIKGVEYQHGTLFGYEMKEYLLHKYGHTCQYCGGATEDPILEWEHMMSKKNGGTNSEKNAALACNKCNDAKGKLNLDQWLEKLKANPNPSDLDKKRIERITSFLEGHPMKPKNYAVWVNSYRNYLVRSLRYFTNELELATGGKTKYNRLEVLKLPKDHHIDALCVGEVPDGGFKNLNQPVLYIKATGRGNRLRGNTNACGIITVKYKDNTKAFTKTNSEGKITHCFMTGDIVKANIPKGKYAGNYTGRITIRKNGKFAIRAIEGKFDVNHKYCTVLQRTDGYSYSIG